MNDIANTEKKVPTAGIVFGILNCIFGGLGVLSLFNLSNVFNDPTGLYEMLGKDFHSWLILSSILGILVNAWLLACGIGLFYLKAWARKGTLYYAYYSFIMLVVGPSVTFLTASEINDAPSLVRDAFWFGIAISIVFGLVYAVLLMIFMKKESMREAYG
jgi:hypothetical protein